MSRELCATWCFVLKLVDSAIAGRLQLSKKMLVYIQLGTRWDQDVVETSHSNFIHFSHFSVFSCVCWPFWKRSPVLPLSPVMIVKKLADAKTCETWKFQYRPGWQWTPLQLTKMVWRCKLHKLYFFLQYFTYLLFHLSSHLLFQLLFETENLEAPSQHHFGSVEWPSCAQSFEVRQFQSVSKCFCASIAFIPFITFLFYIILFDAVWFHLLLLFAL